MTEEKIEEGQVITDERTGEEIPKGANQIMLASNQNTHVEIAKVGTLELTPKAEEVLNEKLNPADVKIRPDGLVYLPWTYYSNKLNQAFGRLQWGLLPQGAPHVKPQGDYGDMLVVWGFWLAIKGVPIGFAYGETTYKPSNATMSYGDACEGAKSIALARNCKQLGIALELWDADWVAAWKRENAETYDNPNQNAKQKKLWRKKGQKSAQKPEASKAHSTESQQEAPQSTESHESSKDAPEPQKTAPSGLYVKDLKLVKNVEIVKHSCPDKDIPTIMKTINGLDQSKTYTIEQIVEMVKAG